MARTNRRKNTHHLLWEGRMHNGLRKVARELPCLKVSLDSEVHALLHRLYRVPNLLTQEDASFLIERHRSRVCGCYDTSGNVVANIFEIGVPDDEEGDNGTQGLLYAL